MNMLGEEPPYLSVGTEVSAKYKGAFCEAKIKGLLRVGANIEARHPEKKEFVEGSIIKIQDCSQYTVVFDDGDITTLRRSALCLKSGRHFAESETLDQLPLTHPEHFGNPVVGGRRGGRRRLGSDDSSGEEEVPRKGKPREERETEIGKVVCVEISDKKKMKDNWFPGLVVSPNAQANSPIDVKEEFLVRSFKDARYFTVPKKETSEFTREIGLKVENQILKAAVEKALTFLDTDELPPHWDRGVLFSLVNSEDSDSDAGMDSDSSDDEPREEKDHFVAQLYKFMDDRGTPINVCPSVCSRDLDLYKLFKLVHKMNGYNRVSNQNQWKVVSSKLGFGNSPGIVTQVKHAYKRFLHSFEDFYRKLGCTMVNHPRAGRSRNRGGRSLIRDKDRSTPVNLKVESALTPKREEAGTSQELAPVVEVKKIVVKEEEVKSKIKMVETKTREKEESKEGDGPSDSEPLRPMSTLRKKFPTLKASPRTKDETPVLKRRAETRPEVRPPSTRPKRAALRENSVDDGRISGEESMKVSQGPDEQRSTTRAKSKEDMVKQLVKKEIRDVRRGKSSSKSSDSEGSKKSKSGGSEDAKKLSEWPKGKRPAGDDPAAKRNRKRRNTDSTAASGPETPAVRPSLPRNKSVFIGDVLKVYYGSSNDPNGIYEAKVLDIEENESGEQLFLVHYAGWNSRYDEWVKRNKIAENLTWTARRAKASPVKGGKLGGVKRKAPVGKGEPARSTTPSSITSSSSRTKSPATTPVATRRRMTRRDRPTLPGLTMSRRTRRISGHTEVSIDSQSDSGSESDESESDSETKSEDPVSIENSPKKNPSGTLVKKAMTRSRPVKKPPTDNPSDTVEKKKPRIVKNSVKVEKEMEDVVASSEVFQVDIAPKRSESTENHEDTSEKPEAVTEDPPKGRDFDLNEIRSELKGIDKAVKVPDACELRETEAEADAAEMIEAEADAAEMIEDGEVLDVRLEQRPDNPEEIQPVKLEEPDWLPLEQEPEVKPTTSGETAEAPVLLPEEKIAIVEDAKEDVYEFKEPEPFEFQEVRRPIRIFDEIIERSPEKSITVKNVSVATSPMRATFEKREPSPQDDMKSRFRKSITKKLKEGCEEKRNVEAEIKTEGEMHLSKEAPKLEAEEDLPPQLVSVPTVDEEPLKQEEPEEALPQVPTPLHKTSPEPPCLIPVTESLPCRPPEHSPVLTREDPPPPPRLPRLSTEISSSDSESDERLVIANDDESTSSEVKLEPLPPPPIASPPPPLFLEERRETKRSPLSEIRLKRVEDRIKNASCVTVEPQVVKESIPSKPSTSGQKVVVTEKPTEEKVREPDCSDSEGGTSSASSGEGMRSLVCDEVIPGSPAPKDPADELSFQPPAASVMENTPPTTPPTTPDSNASSPREDRVGRLYQSMELSSLDNESSKSHRDSSEVDLDNEGHRHRGIKFEKRLEKEQSESPSKKKRSRKRSECNSESSKRGAVRGVGSGNRGSRRDAHASDSDDTSENSMGIHRLDPLLNNRSPRPSKYNFCKEMAPDLDGSQKIAFLQHQLQELRKAYVNVKSQLASIDRRRKKLRRKEREEKQAAAASAAAAAAAAEAAKVQDIPSQ